MWAAGKYPALAAVVLGCLILGPAPAPAPAQAPAALPGGASLTEGLRVELRAPTMVMLSAPVGGRLTRVLARDGETVKKGQLLVQIDDRLHRLRLDIARAARSQAETQFKLAEKLYGLGSRGALDVAMARAQFEGADAEMRLAAEMVGLCRVNAPWNGRVSQSDIKENQHITEGAPLLEITEDGPLEVEFMMPSSWIARFRSGSRLNILVDETGRTYPAEIQRLSGKIDPLTQSIRVYAALVGADDRLWPGMTGTVVVPSPE